MASYSELKKQISELEKKAMKARKAEIASVIASIKKQVKEYELTVIDIFGKALETGAKKLKAARKKINVPNPPKYRDPKTGKTWTGRGKPPQWIAEAIKQGRKDDFLISGADKPTADATQPKSAAKTPRAAVKVSSKGPKAATKKTAKPARKSASKVTVPATAPALETAERSAATP